MNDILAAKALIAFDARVNSINTFNETPLDIVLKYRPDAELNILLCTLGAISFEKMVTDQDLLNNREGLERSSEICFTKLPIISADMHLEINHFPQEGQRILCLDGDGIKVRRVKVCSWAIG